MTIAPSNRRHVPSGSPWESATGFHHVLSVSHRVAGLGGRLAAALPAIGMAAALAACGQSSSADGDTLRITPTNSAFLVGVDRIGVAVLDAGNHPVLGATVSIDLQGSGGTFETRPLQYVGSTYGGGNFPLYVGVARFPAVGQYRMLVHAALPGGGSNSGKAFVNVSDHSAELPVGHAVPVVRQRILSDPGTRISDIDSGATPDPWHDTTIADGLAQHRPMVLFFGEPGFCVSQVCGPSVEVLRQLSAEYGDRLLFEHIEVHSPAGPNIAGAQDNPAFAAFGLSTDPWVYFVNSQGIVADRFEGALTIDELRTAAQGTLAGRVPAVDVKIQ